MGVEDVNQNSIETTQEYTEEKRACKDAEEEKKACDEAEEERGDDENFENYEWEKKVYKNSLKKRVSQMKRLLSNKASNEYSNVDEQQQSKSIPNMLFSISKINDLKGKIFLMLHALFYTRKSKIRCKLVEKMLNVYKIIQDFHCDMHFST